MEVELFYSFDLEKTMKKRCTISLNWQTTKRLSDKDMKAVRLHLLPAARGSL